MGQYHKVYNLDKKEMINGHHIDNGLKLMEQCGHKKSTADAVWLLIANSNGRGGGDAREHDLIGSWAGHRIIVQGDYADKGDPSFLSDDDLDGYFDISEQVRQMLNTVFA